MNCLQNIRNSSTKDHISKVHCSCFQLSTTMYLISPHLRVDCREDSLAKFNALINHFIFIQEATNWCLRFFWYHHLICIEASLVENPICYLYRSSTYRSTTDHTILFVGRSTKTFTKFISQLLYYHKNQKIKEPWIPK